MPDDAPEIVTLARSMLATDPKGAGPRSPGRLYDDATRTLAQWIVDHAAPPEVARTSECAKAREPLALCEPVRALPACDHHLALLGGPKARPTTLSALYWSTTCDRCLVLVLLRVQENTGGEGEPMSDAQQASSGIGARMDKSQGELAEGFNGSPGGACH